jgi:PAS domain S-box-containing protein
LGNRVRAGDPRREVAALQKERDGLLERAMQAEQALAAFARGEVDAVIDESSATPILVRAAQEALRQNEELLRAVFDGALDAMLLADDRGVYVDANPAACSLFDVPRGALVGRSMDDFGAPGQEGDTFRILRERGQIRRTVALSRADGSLRTVEFSARANVVPGRHLAVLHDVTERMASEDRIRISRDLFEEAQAIAHVGSWTSGLSMDSIIEWTPECGRIFDLPEETQVTVGSIFARVPPEDRASLERATVDAISLGLPIDIEHRIERSDGRACWVRARARVDRDYPGGPRMVGTVQDVTDRHAALEALRDSEARYRRIVETTSDGVWMYDANNVTTFMSQRMAEMLRCEVEDAVGKPVFLFIDRQRHAEAHRRIAERKAGKSERLDFTYTRKDGTELRASVQANSMLDSEGRFEAGLAVIADVSERAQADETRARLAAIVESSDDAIIGTTLDGKITTWNLGAESLYQYSRAEAVGTDASLLAAASSPDAGRLIDRVALGEAIRQLETLGRRKDGSVVEVAVTVSPIRGSRAAEQETVGFSIIARDLTARRQIEAALRRSEEQFRHAQKMEAVGRLAGGVAHDFNNLLSVILSYTELSLMSLKQGDPMRDDVLQMQTAGRRATELTRQLLAFSRQQVLEPRVLDVNEVLASMQRMLARLLGEDIELSIVPARDLGRVLADQGQLEQVLMNLAVNARDAMPNGGSLTLSTTNIELDTAYVGAHLGVSAGDYVMLSVSDTGVGMDAATQARIFEPFFTTKGAGKGTGLGLATVFGIVTQSGGQIGVYSEVGHGTTFKIYLPRTDRVASPADPLPAPATLRGSETILLVEDETQVRIVACAILRRNGYHVLESANGGEALLISRELEGRIHLLLTDVVMPRMSGRQLAEELSPGRPEMRILFTSGYTDDAVVHHGVLDAGVAFLRKPFTPGEILRKVREVLDAPAPRKLSR